MLLCLGDLIEDIVVALDSPIHVASDTTSRIVRRRGGSAANVAATAGVLGMPVRFIGQVGGDSIGAALVDELTTVGVDTTFVARDGTTGTIIVLVDDTGERSMLTDRQSCISLDDPHPSWLDGVSVLHVPLYGLAEGPLAATVETLIDWSHDRDIPVSIDASSVSLIESMGVEHTRQLLSRLRPAVLFANEAEARTLDIEASERPAITIVKRGAGPASVLVEGSEPHDVPALDVGPIEDSTAAGDAFAAGFLTADWQDDPIAACRSGHASAVMVLQSRQA